MPRPPRIQFAGANYHIGAGSDPLFVFSRSGGCGRVSKWHFLYMFNFRVQSSMAGATLDGRHASRIGRTIWLRHPDTVRGLLGRGEAAMTGSAKLRKETGQLRREIQHQTRSMAPICPQKTRITGLTPYVLVASVTADREGESFRDRRLVVTLLFVLTCG